MIQERFSRLLPLLILVLLLGLSAPPSGAAFWGDETPRKENLDAVVARLCDSLCDQVNLRREPVLISTSDLYDAASGLSLPLALQLRGKFISAMKQRGARVLLPGCDEDRYLILQGTWQREGEKIAFDVKIMRLGGDGPEAVAAASESLPLAKIDHQALVADIATWGRYLVRKLEYKNRNRRRYTVYVRKVRPRGDLRRRAEISVYLGDWLRTALAESDLYRVLDPQVALRNLEVSELRARSRSAARTKPDKAGERADNLTSDLLRAEAELWGSVWRNHDNLEVRASILDQQGRQVSAATVTVPRELFPDYLVNHGSAPASKGLEVSESDAVAKGDLKVEISTNRGDLRPRFVDGDQIRFLVRLNRDAFVYIFYLNPDGSASLLYPLDRNSQPDNHAPKLPAKSLLVLPDDGCPYDLKACEPFGTDRVKVLACEKRLQLPAGDSPAWTNADTLLSALCGQAFKLQCGYAENQVELVIAPH